MFGQTFTLGLSHAMSWSGGDADCVARLITYTRRGSVNVLATTTFHVYP